MTAEQLITVDPREAAKAGKLIRAHTDEIKFLFHRSRNEEVFSKELKEAIREVGVRQVLKGIDISTWKPQDRRRPDGGLYHYLVGFGEGRTRASQELFKETGDPQFETVPLLLVKVPAGELLLWFITENTHREQLPWLEMAELMRADLDAGLTPTQLAEKNHMTPGHVEKLLRVLNRTSPKVLEEVRQMTVADAEELSRQSHATQEIIIETIKEIGLPGSQTPAVVHMAQEEVAKGVTLSKAVLVARIERLKQAVKDQRASLKLKRTHVAIGPQIYGDHLLKDRKFLALLKKKKIETKTFMEAWEK